MVPMLRSMFIGADPGIVNQSQRLSWGASSLCSPESSAHCQQLSQLNFYPEDRYCFAPTYILLIGHNFDLDGGAKLFGTIFLQFQSYTTVGVFLCLGSFHALGTLKLTNTV